MYLFIDESGDLGFDFSNPGTPKHFVLTLLKCNHLKAAKQIRSSIKKTLNVKVNKNRHNLTKELKGSETPLHIKKYFYNHICKFQGWVLYSIILDKKQFKIPRYITSKSDIYDMLAGSLISSLNANDLIDDIIITIDKCKSPKEIIKCNQHLESVIYPKMRPHNKLDIYHSESQDDKAIQAVDLFCHGLFEKYEYKEMSWYQLFSNKIICEKT